MTKPQISLYWREWSAVRRARPDADRHQLHIQALGHDISHQELTNQQFNRILQEFWAISRPNDIDAQLRQIQMPRTNLMWKIAVEQAACLHLYGKDPLPYINSIITDKFGWGRDLADLSEHRSHPDHPSELEQLMMTLAARIDVFRRQAHHTKKDMLRLSNPLRSQLPSAQAVSSYPEPELAPVTDAEPF